MPETAPELSPEEQDKRFKKVEAIRKMLSETAALSGTENGQYSGGKGGAARKQFILTLLYVPTEPEQEDEKSSVNKKKLEEEKRQRNHILQLNQILAQQVMERSKLVAGKLLYSILFMCFSS